MSDKTLEAIVRDLTQRADEAALRQQIGIDTGDTCLTHFAGGEVNGLMIAVEMLQIVILHRNQID